MNCYNYDNIKLMVYLNILKDLKNCFKKFNPYVDTQNIITLYYYLQDACGI